MTQDEAVEAKVEGDFQLALEVRHDNGLEEKKRPLQPDQGRKGLAEARIRSANVSIGMSAGVNKF